jgi:hypothetical protein
MSTRMAPPSVGVRDDQGDVNALAWDLTVHQLYEAFAPS